MGKPHWIQDAVGKKNALHKELGVAAGKKIPLKMLDKAAHSKGKLGQRARLAETLRSFHK